MSHICTAKKDGNSFPGGLRLSWGALSAITAVLVVVFFVAAAFNGLMVSRLGRIEEGLDTLSDSVAATNKSLLEHVSDYSVHRQVDDGS